MAWECQVIACQEEGTDITTIYINRRFHGPPESANGGYACGLLASYIGNPAEVTLLRPPPLDTPLAVTRSADKVLLMDGGTVVAHGEAFAGDFPVMEAPTLEEVLDTPPDPDIMKNIWYHGCFVCGSDRAEGDGLRVFANRRLAGGALATVWVPDATVIDDQGLVRSEMIWALLDCPGGWAAQAWQARVIVLGRMAAEISGPIPAGQPYVIMGWQAGQQRRKIQAGTALIDASGQVLAKSRATWIELPTG